MTRKELIAITELLGVISSVALEIDYYSIDYDCESIGKVADRLREAV